MIRYTFKAPKSVARKLGPSSRLSPRFRQRLQILDRDADDVPDARRLAKAGIDPDQLIARQYGMSKLSIENLTQNPTTRGASGKDLLCRQKCCRKSTAISCALRLRDGSPSLRQHRFVGIDLNSDQLTNSLLVKPGLCLFHRGVDFFIQFLVAIFKLSSKTSFRWVVFFPCEPWRAFAPPCRHGSIG